VTRRLRLPAVSTGKAGSWILSAQHVICHPPSAAERRYRGGGSEEFKQQFRPRRWRMLASPTRISHCQKVERSPNLRPPGNPLRRRRAPVSVWFYSDSFFG